MCHGTAIIGQQAPAAKELAGLPMASSGWSVHICHVSVNRSHCRAGPPGNRIGTTMTHRIRAETQRLHPKRQRLEHFMFQLTL